MCYAQSPNCHILLGNVIKIYLFPQIVTTENCASEPERGPCKAKIPRYYFDKDENICKTFIYGGCEGNLNNYETKKDCFKTCGDCNSKPDTGPCLALFPRFYFDQDHKTCKRFDYGGCLGNNNNFQTKEICSEACQDKPIADGKYSIFQCNERIYKSYYIWYCESL